MATSNDKFINNKGHNGPRVDPSVHVSVHAKRDLDNSGAFLLELYNSEEIAAELKRSEHDNYKVRHFFVRMSRTELLTLANEIIGAVA